MSRNCYTSKGIIKSRLGKKSCETCENPSCFAEAAVKSSTGGITVNPQRTYSKCSEDTKDKVIRFLITCPRISIGLHQILRIELDRNFRSFEVLPISARSLNSGKDSTW
jgi:hypothetical protein